MTHKAFSFEKLETWKVAKDFAIFLYQLTSKFPDAEKYDLIRQLRKAAVGIPSHLAEGSGRITGKDKAHFTSIAYSTLMEVVNQLILSYEFGYLNEDDYFLARNKASNLSYLLSRLRRSQLQ